MPMNQVIQEKRKALGLTQEQLAERLGVTAPAVNKWEKGATCPDVMLLAPLARLLGVDLNELLCFHEDLSEKEIQNYLLEITAVFARDGLDAAFDLARSRLREFPNCAALCDRLSVYLDSCMMFSEAPEEARKAYEKEIEGWYAWLCDCEDEEIRARAALMLASRHLRKDDCDSAQKMLDKLPEPSQTDKRLLQAEVYLREGKKDAAGELMARAIMTGVNNLQAFLLKLIDVEISEENWGAAEKMAEIARRAAEIFELWDYDWPIAPLMVAAARKDGPRCVELLDELLGATASPWELDKTTLYRRLAGPEAGNQSNAWRMAAAMIRDLESNPDYAFLRERADFQAMLARHRARVEELEKQA